MFPPFPILGFALAKLRIFISNFRYIHKKQLADKNCRRRRIDVL